MFKFAGNWFKIKQETHSANHLYSAGSPTFLDDAFGKIQTIKVQIPTPNSHWQDEGYLDKILNSLISKLDADVDLVIARHKGSSFYPKDNKEIKILDLDYIIDRWSQNKQNSV